MRIPTIKEYFKIKEDLLSYIFPTTDDWTIIVPVTCTFYQLKVIFNRVVNKYNPEVVYILFPKCVESMVIRVCNYVIDYLDYGLMISLILEERDHIKITNKP